MPTLSVFEIENDDWEIFSWRSYFGYLSEIDHLVIHYLKFSTGLGFIKSLRVNVFWCRTTPENWPAEDPATEENGSQKPLDWWWDEEGLFNLDEIGRSERQQCAVAASNVIRNFSFMPENEAPMAQHRACLETLIVCMEDHEIGKQLRTG